MAHNVNRIPLMNRFLDVSGSSLLFGCPGRPMKGKRTGPSRSRGPRAPPESQVDPGSSQRQTHSCWAFREFDGSGSVLEPKVGSREMDSHFGTKV